MILKVRKNFGTNCPANSSETTAAMINPAASCSGISQAAMKSSTPEMDPATSEIVLPALT